MVAPLIAAAAAPIAEKMVKKLAGDLFKSGANSPSTPGQPASGGAGSSLTNNLLSSVTSSIFK
jgi:hypothetical protein